MEQAIARLEGAMELRPYSVPEGMEGKEAVVGKGRNQQQVKMTVAAYSAAKFRHIRAALVETSGPTQVLNFVIFPDPSLDLPIFGADLVSLPGAHLICIDLQARIRFRKQLNSQYQKSQHTALAAHAQARLPWGGNLPSAAQRFFSPHCIWSKVGDIEVVETAALEAMLAYLDHYLAMAAAAEPVKDEGLLKGLAEGHLAYSRYRRINDPARGMLTRFFGTEWAEDVISHALFDLEAKVDSGAVSLAHGQELLAEMAAEP
ncbi:ferredoxin-dependent bilin reductase [Tribonema minus]|uniref:Ferredoxin-dependent bilin reductase n=1 Tax=Tribonema minus TaxID=303371 RepID=A0A836CI75_9STRA|nr:ferredoxin-dependent bilin reductase [Tribonema minus]